MLERSRLKHKKESKTEAVQAVAERRLEDENIHVGPSDYVAWQKDNKVCFLRMEGRMFGNVPLNLELRLSVEDSPNSAGVAIDMIRCAKLALDRGEGGPVEAPAAFFCKHPPRQMTDDEADTATEAFIRGEHSSKPRLH
jgi:myo-inositol-1-phosphate synthase